jgi:hypothetical protein
MKKLLAFATVVALATSASAASLSWGPGSGAFFLFKPGETVSSMAKEFIEDGGGTVPDGAKFVLVYLGQSTSLDVSSITSDMIKDSISFGYTTDTWGDSLASKDAQTITILESDGYSAGDSFAVAWFDGKSYKDIYDVSYDSGDVGNALSTVVTINNGFTATVRYSTTATTSSSDSAFAVSVPEPATAALALLGLGMLLKRRKA